jgi:hypothetical protein
VEAPWVPQELVTQVNPESGLLPADGGLIFKSEIPSSYPLGGNVKILNNLIFNRYGWSVEHKSPDLSQWYDLPTTQRPIYSRPKQTQQRPWSPPSDKVKI